MNTPTKQPVSKQYPLGHLMNPATPYSNAVSTDVRATIAKWKQAAGK